MAVSGYFFNAVLSGGVYDRTYNAEDMTSYLADLVGNGVFPNPSSSLQVRAGTGMQVIVGAGAGWINGYKLVNTADMTLSIDAADPVLARRDLVIFYLDHSTRSMGIAVKKGTASNSPVEPTLTRSATRYEMCLARIRVNAGMTSITDARIDDYRMNSQLCGIVQGLIQQVDTTTLWQQQQDEFNYFMSQLAPWTKLEGIYRTQVNGETTFTVTDYVPDYYSQDILEIYVSGEHLSMQDYTLDPVNAVVTLTGVSVRAGAVIDFVVYHQFR